MFFLSLHKYRKYRNEIFVDRNYGNPGQTSKPEWGINISKKNYSFLEIFKFEEAIKNFLKEEYI